MAEAGEKIVNQDKAIELLWSQKQEVEMEVAQLKAHVADVETQRMSVQADMNGLRASVRALKDSLLAGGTRLNVKDAKVLEFFHSL